MFPKQYISMYKGIKNEKNKNKKSGIENEYLIEKCN